MFVTLISLIFIRPFISSLAFPFLNLFHTLLLIGGLLIWSIIHKGSLNAIRPLRYPLAIFCAAVVMGIVFSKNRINSADEVYKYVGGLLLVCFAASLPIRERLRLIRTITLAGFIISLLALYQYFFGFRHIIDYVTRAHITNPFMLDYLRQKRVFFPFVTPNTLAGYLIMLIPLVLINKKNAVWFLVPISCALLLTKSLGAYISIFLALWMYLYLQRRLTKQWGLLLFGILLIMSLVFIVRSADQKQHLQPLFSTAMRLGYWKDTLLIIKTHPFLGVGLGNFGLMQSRFAHNSHLQIWAEMGLFGILGWLWLIVQSFAVGMKKVRSLHTGNNTIVLLLTAHAAFLIHNLIDFSFLLPEVSMIWWLIVGLIISEETLSSAPSS